MVRLLVGLFAMATYVQIYFVIHAKAGELAKWGINQIS